MHTNVVGDKIFLIDVMCHVPSFILVVRSFLVERYWFD